MCDYNFNNPVFSDLTGHFTQVVWKTSTQLGISFARGTYAIGGQQYANCLFVVGRYKEEGNMTGTFAQNVAKGSFNKQTSCPPPGRYRKRNKLYPKSKRDKNKRRKNVVFVL